jgi:hypothetical protein
LASTLSLPFTDPNSLSTTPSRRAKARSDKAGSGASGVRGIALVGPTCPFGYPGRSCPDRPLAGVVVEAGGRKAVTGTDGRFRIKLAPDRYALSAANPRGVDRLVRKQAVTVAANRFSLVRLDFDSGIR